MSKLKIAGIVVLAVFLAFAGWVGEGVYQEYARHDDFREGNAALLALAGIEKSEGVSHQFDKLRELVNAHSVHRIDGQFRAFGGDMTQMTDSVYRYAAGYSEEPPPLECSARAGILANLLRVQGHKARIVALFSPGEGFKSHTLVEAYNPVARRWEIQDPDYNVFYVFKGSTQRVGIEDMLAQPIDNFQPCQMDGYCGWDSASPEGLTAGRVHGYFAAAIVQENGGTTLVVNKKRYDINEKHTIVNGAAASFCDAWPAVCAGKKVFYEG